MVRQPSGPWTELLQEAKDTYALETAGAETSVAQFIEWLAEWGRDLRRRQRGLLLLTAHRAKGLEFDHVVVLDGGWDRLSRGEDADAPRRLYYVAMSRARQTLTLARLQGAHRFQDGLQGNSSALLHRPPVTLPPPTPELARQYRRLGLRDIFLSFAGYKHPNHPVHGAIAALAAGDPLQVRVGAKRWGIAGWQRSGRRKTCQKFRRPAGNALHFCQGPGRRCLGPRVLRAAVPERPSARSLGSRPAGAGVRAGFVVPTAARRGRTPPHTSSTPSCRSSHSLRQRPPP